MTVEATQKGLDALCHVDAPYLARRLAARLPAGVLSIQEYMEADGWEGVPLCTTDIVGMVVIWASVSLDYNSTKYQTGAAAVEALGEVVGPTQAAEFLSVPGGVYFHSLKIMEYFGSAGAPAANSETPELHPDGVAKSLDLSRIPLQVLHAAFTKLDTEYTSGLTTADRPPGKMREQGQEIFAAIQKRVPHIEIVSTLLQDPTATPAPRPITKPIIAPIVKSADTPDPEWMYVLSLVLEPNDGQDGAELNPDFDGEIYDRHLIRKIAFPYARKYRGLGIMHDGGLLGEDEARVVQCYVVDDGAILSIAGKDYGPGSWFLGAEVKRSSETGKKIESGELGAWSIDGIALKVPETIGAAA